ncbi:WD40 repeat-like protein, partial [Suillus weaverae]
FSIKYTLARHTKAVNILAVNVHGTLLLTGGNDSQIVVWSLVSGEMMQEIFTPAAGYISAITWMHGNDHSEMSFAFGASDGNIQVYERSNDELFEFQSMTISHSSAVESLAWDPVHQRLASAGSGRPHVWKFTSDKTLILITLQLEKQPYVARTVHFYDNGASLLVSFLESGEIFCYSIEPWDLKWRKKVQGRIGNAIIDGNFLLMSNLKDRVDKYAIPTLQHVQSYSHVILRNVPLQISVAREAGLLFVGGDDGFACAFDYNTGAYRGQLTHGNQGDQIIPVMVSLGT